AGRTAPMIVPEGIRSQVRALPKGTQVTGCIPVAVNGAVGMEETTFKIAFQAPELGLPSPLNFESTHRVNYDEQLQSSATETVESANPGWTVSGSASELPNVTGWQRRALSPV